MHPATLRAAAALPLLAALAGVGSCSLPPTPLPTASISCDAQVTARSMTTFAASDVAVSFETAGDAGLELTRVDMADYLARLWGSSFPVSTAAPDFTHRATLWLSTSAAAVAEAKLPADMTYAIRRTDGPSGTVLVVAAHDAVGLTYGAYALLEELGARFFHPKQELVPSFGSPRLPTAIDIARAPAMASRGIQFHTLHPIEYMPAFNEPSAANLADAERVIDWLVKTGQNYVQWALVSTVDFGAFRPHAQAIIAYAHRRGVKVGAVVQMWGGASLQNNYVLVTDQATWQAEMDAALDQLVTVGWDTVELALGEFVATDPQTVIDWMNHAVTHLATAAPAVEVNAQNHVGNYPNLYVQYQGQTVFYYHLPQFADARLGQTVHTLAFFDVYRDWATYKHADFHLQHDYVFRELPTRRVKYFPESAYWISADIDVPLFLPMFLVARWNDIHGMVAEARGRGLPPLAGHVQFNTGHEWGYWLTDYLTAKMLWQPDAPLASFLTDYSAAFGSCAGDVATTLSALVAVETRYLFDQRLAAYVQGENTTVDAGALIGLETHPQRVAFEDLLTLSAAERATFEGGIVVGLEAMVSELSPLEGAFAARCRGADATLAPWCDELWDGTAIVRNRAEHTALLYRAMLAQANGDDPEPYYNLALTMTAEAQTIVARREAQYRFDLDRLTGVYANPTVYDFGSLRPAHTQCYWVRREMQVRTLLDTGTAAGLAALPSCTDE